MRPRAIRRFWMPLLSRWRSISPGLAPGAGVGIILMPLLSRWRSPRIAPNSAAGVGTTWDRIQLRLGWRFGRGYHAAQGDQAVLDAAAQQMEEYFARTRTEFELPVWAPGRRLGAGVARVAAHSVGADPYVWANSCRNRPAEGYRFRGPGGRRKPTGDHRSLPPGGGQRRPLDQLRRRPVAQTPSAGTGASGQTDCLKSGPGTSCPRRRPCSRYHRLRRRPPPRVALQSVRKEPRP